MPLYSGSRGGANRNRVARVPANAAAITLTSPRPPIADSRSHRSVFGARPMASIGDHIPAVRSPPCRDGSMIADWNLEYVFVITSTGTGTGTIDSECPCPTGIETPGNQRSHLRDLTGLVHRAVPRIDPDLLRPDLP